MTPYQMISLGRLFLDAQSYLLGLGKSIARKSQDNQGELQSNVPHRWMDLPGLLVGLV